MFEREMAYLLNRFQTICRMRELTAVVLERTEKQEEQPANEAGRSDEQQSNIESEADHDALRRR